jgi:cytochrome c-type biogenesis protein CcmH/NrfG
MKKVVTPEHAAGQRADRRALAEINDLIDDGVYDAASVLAWEVQRASPGDPAVWLLLARIDYLRERFAAAMYAARMATRLDPASSDAWLALAMTGVTRPRWQTEGLDAALQATALAPADPRSWTVLSQLQLAGGATYEAAVAAEQAVRVDPSDRGGHLMLGETALEVGELAHAEAAFRRVLELDSDDPDGRMGLAETLEAQGIDPTAELTRYGAPVFLHHRRSRLSDRVQGLTAAVAPARAGSDRSLAVIVVGGSLLLGLFLGLAVPGLGVVRGLVGAVALALMWIAVRPLRTAGPDGAPTRPVGDTADDSAPTVDSRDADDTDGDEDEVDAARVEAAAGRTAAAVLGDASLARELAVDVEAHDAAQRAGTVPGPPVPDREDATASASAEAPVAEDDEATPPESTVDDVAAFQLPDDPDELAELSRARLAASDLELAHAAASRLEAVAPGTLEAHRALGAVALAEQDYEQARLHYRSVLDLEPLDQEAHERLALVSASLGRPASRFALRGFRSRR